MNLRTVVRWVCLVAGIGLGFAYFHIAPRMVFLGPAIIILFLGLTDFGRQCPLFQGLKNVIVQRKGLYEKIDH